MKRTLIIVGIIVVILLIFYFPFQFTYNSMVNKQATTEQAWADVESQYQRRADLVPNLVSTVQGAANFEKSTITQVVEARAKVGTVQVDASKLTPESIQKYQEAQDGLSSSLSRLLVVAENYPDLKATENFSELQAQLEGTENRINKARDDFNKAVQSYNSAIRRFPNSIIANMYGFEKKGYFQSAPGSENAPKVQF